MKHRVKNLTEAYRKRNNITEEDGKREIFKNNIVSLQKYNDDSLAEGKKLRNKVDIEKQHIN